MLINNHFSSFRFFLVIVCLILGGSIYYSLGVNRDSIYIQFPLLLIYSLAVWQLFIYIGFVQWIRSYETYRKSIQSTHPVEVAATKDLEPKRSQSKMVLYKQVLSRTLHFPFSLLLIGIATVLDNGKSPSQFLTKGLVICLIWILLIFLLQLAIKIKERKLKNE